MSAFKPINTCIMFRRSYCTLSFFSPSSIRYSAFLYRQTFSHLFPNELLLFVQPNNEFAKNLDNHAATLFKTASSLEEIRAVYTGKELEQIIEEIIAEQHPASRDELINLSRMIIKWCARYRMHELGFAHALDAIHRDNEQRYGNSIGPTPSFLKQKYHNNPRGIANASKRFRSNEAMKTLTPPLEDEPGSGSGIHR